MICCDQQCETAFCPVCGKPQTDGIFGLLSYIQRRIKTQLTNRKKVEPENAVEADQRIEMWRGWEKAVVELQEEARP